MKVLVTGVAGFIGSNLAEALLSQGHTVFGIDNLSQGNFSNISEYERHPAFTFMEDDVRNAGVVSRLVSEVDCVVHLAAFKIPRYGNALDTIAVNIHGTRTVLNAAAKYGCRVVFASTSDVYGRNPDAPFSEKGSALWMGPTSVRRWSYAVSKMYDEHVCFAYRDSCSLPIVILRFFGGYGPRQNLTWWGGPQSVFINAALNDAPMEIHGDGKQTRSFTYISDHVEGIIRCLERSEAVGNVINLGSTEETSILDLATLIWSLAGSGAPKFNFISYRSFGKYEDVRRRVPNISRAKKLLAFEPQVSLLEGLARTIAWQKALTSQPQYPDRSHDPS
jgi:UDP-glucose 4-epimerase